jgi:transcription initiation factor TFIIIB Brf1 subunit/transcription initiation factor TFIIB
MTTDFELFDEILADYENLNINQEFINDCEHSDLVEENGSIVCSECGIEIRKTITHEKEWRFYGNSDKRSDPNRVQIRKSEEKSIIKDVETMGFSESIVSKANEFYSQVTQGQIYRGNSRKGIVFACIFHAYKINKNHQPFDDLIKIFGLNKKVGLKGMKIVKLNTPKNSDIHKTFITPQDLICDVMEKFSATESQIDEVINLYSKIKNKSSKLNRARPQSVASSLAYYWITIKNIDISLKEFSKKVELSELTISRNVKEIENILLKRVEVKAN